MTQDKYCLVLSGGGAKGVYHIGVWKALRELGVDIGAVVGNSIGAIIGAFIAQGAHDALEDIGKQIGLDYVLNIPEELIENGELSINLSKWNATLQLYKSFARKKGLDTSPLRELLESHIDEKKIRSGPTDFGLVTFNVTDMEPREVFLEKMEPGEMVNYIIASATVPGFERTEIAGKKYIDGGVFDNIPFAMARSRGYTNFIVVDISGAGVNRRPDLVGTRTVYIKNSINMGGLLDFDRKFIADYSRLGYLDTLRVFGRLRGMSYFITPDPAMEKRFEAFLEAETVKKLLLTRPSIIRKGESETVPLEEAMTRILPKKRRHDPCRLAILADCAAIALDLERVRKWRYPELFEALIARRSEVRAEGEEIDAGGRKAFITQIGKELQEKRLLKTPYIYHLLGDRFLPDRLKVSLERFIISHHPELASGVFFLDILDDFMETTTALKTSAK
jgi:NTE family protein